MTGSPVTSESHGLRLVIADDDDEIRHCLRVMLELDHFEVVGEAATGREAVARALEAQPDVIILDYRLPQLNGEQAAEMIRGVVPGVKILAFSAACDGGWEWADRYLDKARIAHLGSEIDDLYRSYAV